MFGRLAPKAHYGEARTGRRQQRARVPTQDTFSLRVAVLFALAGCQPHRAPGPLPRRNLANSWNLADSRKARKALATRATFAQSALIPIKQRASKASACKLALEDALQGLRGNGRFQSVNPRPTPKHTHHHHHHHLVLALLGGLPEVEPTNAPSKHVLSGLAP